VFELAEPLKIEVLEGRIRGQVKKAIDFPIPKYDEKLGAYVMPDGHAVQVRGDKLIDVPMPVRPDAGPEAALEATVQQAPPAPPGTPSSAPLPASDARGRFDPKAPPNPKTKPPVFFSKPEG
jgi:hypothetical protein